jgi:hypothetical protein
MRICVYVPVQSLKNRLLPVRRSPVESTEPFEFELSHPVMQNGRYYNPWNLQVARKSVSEIVGVRIHGLNHGSSCGEGEQYYRPRADGVARAGTESSVPSLSVVVPAARQGLQQRGHGCPWCRGGA